MPVGIELFFFGGGIERTAYPETGASLYQQPIIPPLVTEFTQSQNLAVQSTLGLQNACFMALWTLISVVKAKKNIKYGAQTKSSLKPSI